MASKAIDTVITFRVLKLLTTKWEDHEAFKTGLIDANGKRIKSKKSDIIAVKKDISIKVNRYDWEKCMTNPIKH